MSGSLDDRAAEMRREFDRSFADAPRAATEAPNDLVAIRIGGDPYALRVAEIAGLHVDRSIASVPSQIPELLGIAGFRGSLVPVFDLGALLGYPAATASRWLAIAAGTSIGFAFEAFDGHVRVAPEKIVPCAPTEAPAYVRAIARDGRQVRPIVHLPSLIEAIATRALPRSKE
jgi:chemotaxis signal transduction protein